MNDAVVIDGDVLIGVNEALRFDGKTLVWSGAFTVTLGSGLPSGFGFAAQPPTTGDAIIAAADSSVLLNGANASVTRAATNAVFALVYVGVDSYVVTGS